MNNCIILTSKHGDAYGRSAGPYRLASFLRDNGWETDLIDYFTKWPREEIIAYLKRHINQDTKWVGVSYTWLPELASVIKQLSDFVKSINPNILIIVGGLTPYEYDLGADYYIYGYAEHALLKVLDYEFNSGPPVFFTKKFSGKYIDAIHSYPAYDLKDYGTTYQDNDFIKTSDILSIEFSRGCKFKCDFCTFPFIGIKEDTSTSEELLYRELMTNYEKWGIYRYFVTDETINDRIEKLIKIKNVVNRLPFKPDFTAFTRADLFRSHPEKIELMAEGRIWGQYYGVETLNWESGKAIGKGLNPEYIKETLLTIREYFLKHVGKYRGTVSMIGGLPHETIDTLRASQKWLVDNWSDQNVVWWTLQIIDNGKLSAMGKDFEKYGYTKIDNVYDRDTHYVPLKNTYMYWKNQHTDIFEINNLISNEFKTHHFTLGNFWLWYMLPYMDYDTASKLTGTEKTFDWIQMGDEHRVTEYINLKSKS